ncbi:retropepsin-like aspartic protease family protein [Nitrosomonas marina]|uniref:Clan AA aspartic protease, TIGR02281 family n=1 Tax=Nitrosomonas marina TaxID=917 RepID=A0A1H8F206_9PROT|nr:retropepsin-like aspartic protease [Nitrosomonas marina]SEN25670.1 clan AA aspartic protease, TIGR02281 family [Nitrosomonas marina]
MFIQKRGNARTYRFDGRQYKANSALQVPYYSYGSNVRAIIIGLAIGLMCLVVWEKEWLPQQNYPAVEQLENNAMLFPSHCQPLPAHGSVYAIEPAFMKRTDVLYSGLQIHNQHGYPMVVVLSDNTGLKQFFAVSIAPAEAVQLSVPIGQYGMQVFFGLRWCNFDSGFADGATALVEGGIAIQTGQTTSLEFYGASLDPIQLALAYRTARPVDPQQIKLPSEVIGDGALELLQTPAGHYFSSGAINGSPVVFMIDTGATTVSISAEIAARAGIKECQPRIVSTANGLVDACSATVSDLTFGKYRLVHVDVTILPDLSGEALLGMNVLRHFRIEQVNEKMTISVR